MKRDDTPKQVVVSNNRDQDLVDLSGKLDVKEIKGSYDSIIKEKTDLIQKPPQDKRELAQEESKV